MTMRSPKLFDMACATALVLALASAAGCGSKQRVEAREVGPPPTFDCMSDRWADPPPDIGQTPPDQQPSALDVDPFLDETRQE